VTLFNVVAGTCGVLAFLVLCLQGYFRTRKERHRLFTRDGVRALDFAQRACELRGLEYETLTGTAPGITVTARAYRVRALRAEGEREGWLAP